MYRIGEERGLISFDEMAKPGQRKSSGDEQQSDDPVEPNDNDRRETDGNGNQVQGAVNGVIMQCAPS